MQVIAVQLNMAWEDKPANHTRVKELLSGQTIEPGSLIILPEMFETGFSMNPAVTAQTPNRDGEAFVKKLAAQFESAVMAGLAGPIQDGRSSNECVVFDPGGSELVRYQKMQPFSLTGEQNFYPAGKTLRLFQWQGITIAPFICYDLRFPELFRSAVKQGAEMITLIACWPATRSEHWVRLLQARAIENLAPVVGINRCGSEPNLRFDGRSSGFDHLGQCLFEATGEEQVITCDIDIDTARRWRSKFPALRDMKSFTE